ncbi:uncharacterized protein LOC110029974 [Phalaenopsis equestris]|uniref:uncharacterized protein LOC110029974 n=1 Tax=Phalaenopsis equestris TaxID=78828 RepID=UPI0009E5B226|nr:uncharacterized protein LOC110029974 [Phalaenopsis equestris]
MKATFSGQHIRQIPAISAALRQPKAFPKQSTLSISKFAGPLKCAVQRSFVEQSAPKGDAEASNLNDLIDFLYDDLPHLFDEQGIDPSMYDSRVRFRDPITKHDTIDGYLLNIRLLKLLFSPDFQLHRVWQSGPFELTTRWTMVMKFVLLPWKPELVFTGVSIMGVNPKNRKFCSHVDLWDSIVNNEYFSLEGLANVLGQLSFYKTPDLETPDYQILKRTAKYEVRKYASFLVAETKGDKLSGSSGFNDVAGYIFGKNSTMEKIPMTTPVFTQAKDAALSEVSIQIVLPKDKENSNLPEPSLETISLRKVEGGFAAAVKFSGRPTEDAVRQKEKELRSALIEAGLKPMRGCMLARYNDPGRTWSFIMRNEVLIWLEEFSLS